jgi:hypothetical protein
LIPADLFERWQKQTETPYSELTDKEKESDREQVRKYLPLIAQALAEAQHIAETGREFRPAFTKMSPPVPDKPSNSTDAFRKGRL